MRLTINELKRIIKEEIEESSPEAPDDAGELEVISDDEGFLVPESHTYTTKKHSSNKTKRL